MTAALDIGGRIAWRETASARWLGAIVRGAEPRGTLPWLTAAVREGRR